MKMSNFFGLAALLAVASITFSTSSARGQDSTAATTTTQSSDSTAAVQTTQPTDSAPVQTTPVAAPVAQAPQMAYGVSQILELSQAKVDDNTIISYVQNSGNSFGLNAAQIIYLRQQGLSSAVINAMLSQPRPGVMGSAPVVQMPSTPAPQVDYSQTAPVYAPSAVGPSVSGI